MKREGVIRPVDRRCPQAHGTVLAQKMGIEEYPDVLLVENGGNISEYLMFQAAMTLMDDPDSALDCEDILIQCGADSSERYPNTHQVYNQFFGSFELAFFRSVEDDLS